MKKYVFSLPQECLEDTDKRSSGSKHYSYEKEGTNRDWQYTNLKGDDQTVKLYSIDVHPQGTWAVFGGEHQGKAFLAVHNLKDPEFSVLGYNSTLMAQMKLKLRELAKGNDNLRDEVEEREPEKKESIKTKHHTDKKHPDTSKKQVQSPQKEPIDPRKKEPSKYEKELREFNSYMEQVLANMAYLQIPEASRCIFQVKFLPHSSSYPNILIAATDFNKRVLLFELINEQHLKMIGVMPVHEDLIQGLCYHGCSLYSCSADRSVARTAIRLPLAKGGEEVHRPTGSISVQGQSARQSRIVNFTDIKEERVDKSYS